MARQQLRCFVSLLSLMSVVLSLPLWHSPSPTSNLHWLMCCAVINQTSVMVWVWGKLSQEALLVASDTLESTGWDSQLKLLLDSRATGQLMLWGPSRNPCCHCVTLHYTQSQSPPSVYHQINCLPDLVRTFWASPRQTGHSHIKSHTANNTTASSQIYFHLLSFGSF